ncbi:MAG: hypothetical protein HY863_01585 [Chloroflexi bacterium]|nr:hypothetical protein [Chloroflexota bacterium]
MPDQEEIISETQNLEFLGAVILKARDALIAVSDACKKPWTKNPSIGIRAFLGYSLVKARRHFAAVIVLCEERDLSMVAYVHHRQMFEIFLQVRYFLSFSQDKMEYLAQKISAWGCLEYLEKLESSKDRDGIKNGYDDMLEQLACFDKNIIDEIKVEKKQRKHNWFGSNFSKLATNVSTEGQDLKLAYQVISNNIHGTWGLALEVANPEPGFLDFRGYPDKSTMYKWAADLLNQVMILYINMWNEIAVTVGAPEI